LIHNIDHYVWKILSKKGDVLEELKKLGENKKWEFDAEDEWMFDYEKENPITPA
jgi:hypothetical protein